MLSAILGINRERLAKQMKITDQQLARLEQLAGLNVKEEERAEVESELADLITYMGMLEDIEDGQGFSTLENVFRADEIGQSFPRQVILQNAPETDGETCLVPRTGE